MSKADDEARRRAERAQTVGLWRHQLIRQAADQELTTRQRGRMVRQIAESTHEGPFGEPIAVSRATLDRWIRDWNRGGFDALVPSPRNVTARIPEQVLELAAALKRQRPERTAAQITRILRATSGWSPSARTLLRHFDSLELNTRPDGQAPRVFGRFEAARPHQLWTGDALHGPKVGRKVELVFDPFDLGMVEVRWNNRPMGMALPQTISRDAHPKAKPEIPAAPQPATGIDYPRLLEDTHHRGLAEAINYAALLDQPDQLVDEQYGRQGADEHPASPLTSQAAKLPTKEPAASPARPPPTGRCHDRRRPTSQRAR
ncbi:MULTISPECIES: helix-turn-helix domain-containing protein [unclassified Nonomuraea]|uniref:helix-turn-helix domain-containing protein n=1 Tax=unclassified Nonomuraea TaxID=2593643 RepID=UPI00340E4BFB